MKKGVITLFSILSVTICTLMQLVIAHKLSTAGIELSKMETEIQSFERKNEKLRHSIASASSLMSIETQAKMLGFTTVPFYHIEIPPMALVLE